MIWIILYVCGFLFTSWKASINFLDALARDTKETRVRYNLDKPLVGGEDRIVSLIAGVATGLIWPISLTFMLVSRKLVSPTEIIHQQEQELKILREQAERFDLPMPEMRDK